ncbi:FxSxx-COOH system tetratricopeptide repeat protein [Nonomuraea sp. NPDC049714]|uniref:FxSxx-COOH system tetratricopeptide repeat protein n=1 Tax=Nonomuraea sp. NPDC049714 TaxID=3364357 RepID=UPI0037A6DAD1
MGAPIWLDYGDKFASIVGAASGVIGLAVAVFGGREALFAGGETGITQPGRRWLRVAAVLGAVALLMVTLRGLGLLPRPWQWPASSAALAVSGLACVAAFVSYVAFRRENIPLPTAIRSLLTEQWQDARRHQYEYFVGDAPPLPEIYVEQKAESVQPVAGAVSSVARLYTIRQMIYGFRNTLVVAEPGIGKSTAVALVLREQCRWWLDARRSDHLSGAPYGSVVPILVPAELLADMTVPEAMAAHCRQVTGCSMTAQLFDRRPDHADAWLVVVDGIDQVLSTKRRSRVLSRLGDSVSNNLPHHRFMITTRPLMLGDLGNLGGEHLTRFTLRRFDHHDLRAFAERWVDHRSRIYSPQMEAEPITIERFLASVSSSRLSAIARVPLIATITALILEADQDSALPTSRAGLYERFIQHLLNSRQVSGEERDRLVAEFTRHGEQGTQAWIWLRDNLRNLLEGTADIFLSGSGGRVTTAAVLWVKGHAPPGLFEGLAGWETSLRGVLTATSLVVPRTGGLQFVHPSFAEYFAAGPRSRDFDQSTWLADARSPDSRNLALFTLARSTYSVDPLVRILLERGGTDACIAGEIVADGITVGTALRREVINTMFEQLARDDRSAPEALAVLINLTSDRYVNDRLAGLAEDPRHPIWVRAFTADALCSVSAEGARLLRAVLDSASVPGSTSGDDVRRWLLERLAARGWTTEQDRTQLAALAPANVGGTSASAMAAQWYRQIAQDSDADPGHRLRALLALAEGGYTEALGPLESVLVHPALTPQARLDGTRVILQLDLDEQAEVLRHISRHSSHELEIRVPVLAAMAGARDTEARRLLDSLAVQGGEAFTARFPALDAWSQETGIRSSEKDADSGPRGWEGVPPRNIYFTGRSDELEGLRQAFATSPTQVVYGLGGAGKTQLAIEYAYRHRADYDVIWWIPADQLPPLHAALAALAPHLRLPPAFDVGTPAGISAVLAALHRGEPYSRWLLIFDNADDPDQLHPYLPQGPGHVLITSRNSRWELLPAQPLDVFVRDESLKFLHRRLPGITDGIADEIASELSDFPMSLENAAALMAETGSSPEGYLKQLHGEIAGALERGRPLEYPASLIASHKASVDRLLQEDPEAVVVLNHCALFGPDPIPYDALSMPDESSAPALSRVSKNPVRLLSVFDRLSRYGLIAINHRLRTVQLPRLVGALIRTELPSEELKRIRHGVHLMLANAAPDDPEDPASWPCYAELVPHIAPTGPEQCADPRTRDLMTKIARYLANTGDHASCLSIITTTIDTWEHDLDPTHSHLRQARSLQAIALRAGRDYTGARKVSRAAFEAAEDQEIHYRLAAAQDFAIDLRLTGLFSAALELDQDAAAHLRELRGETHDATLHAQYRLALDHELTGAYRRAHDLYMGIRRKAFTAPASRYSRLSLLALNGAARTLRFAGGYAAAVGLAADAHALAESFAPASNLDKLLIHKDLVVGVRMAGIRHVLQPGDPLKTLAKLTADLRDAVTSGHPHELAGSISLANALRRSGHLDQAAEHVERALDGYQASLGGNHPFTHCCASNLAIIHRLRGNATAARKRGLSALQGLQETLGPRHPYTLICAVNLASDHSSLGDNERAVDLGRATLPSLRTTLGEDHPLTLACALNLSLDLGRAIDCQASDDLYAQTLDLYRRSLPADHPDTQAANQRRRLNPDIELSPLIDL